MADPFLRYAGNSSYFFRRGNTLVEKQFFSFHFWRDLILYTLKTTSFIQNFSYSFIWNLNHGNKHRDFLGINLSPKGTDLTNKKAVVFLQQQIYREQQQTNST